MNIYESIKKVVNEVIKSHALLSNMWEGENSEIMEKVQSEQLFIIFFIYSLINNYKWYVKRLKQDSSLNFSRSYKFKKMLKYKQGDISLNSTSHYFSMIYLFICTLHPRLITFLLCIFYSKIKDN